jgi:AraC-like DNA-binding protein/mannose-6-phosphate isomerase-like protein (cupin superfamily)
MGATARRSGVTLTVCPNLARKSSPGGSNSIRQSGNGAYRGGMPEVDVKQTQPGRKEAAVRREVPAAVELPPGGIALLESHHASSFAMPLGVWEFHKLCWVSVGRGAVGLEEGEQPLERDRCILLDAGRPHRFIDDPSDPFTLIIVCFHPRVFEAHACLGEAFARLGDDLPFAEPWQGRNAFLTAGLKNHFRELLREQATRAEGHEAMLAARLTQLLIETARGAVAGKLPPARGLARLDGVLAYLEAHFRDPVELDRMARLAGLSRRRFSELFRQRTGQSLVAYVNRRRVDHACARLRETGHIAYSCYESGFQDLAYFYRVFRQQVGQTPGAYLRACGTG